MNTNALIKTAIVGLGGAAKNIHLPLIECQSRLQITAVCSAKFKKAEALFGSRVGQSIQYFSDYHELLANQDIELIILLTPNNTHYQMTLDALQAGKHVVVEKPVSVEPNDIEHLITVSETVQKHVIPFHNRRWDGDYLTVQQLLETNTLGDVKLFESHFDRYRPHVSDKWKEQGGQESGLWYDIGPHLLDQAFELFGVPTAITARLLAMRDGSNEVDYFRTQLHYADKEVILGASNFCSAPVRRFYVEGSKGTFVKHHLDIQNTHLESNVLPSHGDYGVENDTRFGMMYTSGQGRKIETIKGSYPSFYSSVADCILGDQTPPVSMEAALQVAKFLQLGALSQEQNKTLWIRQYRD